MILVLEAAISPLPTPLLDNSPSFIVPYNARWHGISLWLVWVCCPDSVPPPSFLCTLNSSLAEQYKKQKKPQCCASIAMQQINNRCAVNIIVICLDPIYRRERRFFDINSSCSGRRGREKGKGEGQQKRQEMEARSLCRKQEGDSHHHGFNVVRRSVLDLQQWWVIRRCCSVDKCPRRR